MTGEQVLENPDLWQAFLKRLSVGINMQQDVEAIREFAEVLKLPAHRVVNKMRTFCHPGNQTIH